MRWCCRLCCAPVPCCLHHALIHLCCLLCISSLVLGAAPPGCIFLRCAHSWLQGLAAHSHCPLPPLRAGAVACAPVHALYGRSEPLNLPCMAPLAGQTFLEMPAAAAARAGAARMLHVALHPLLQQACNPARVEHINTHPARLGNWWRAL